MKPKLKFQFLIEVEYEADPANYPEDKRTPEGMLEVDLENANEDPYVMMEFDNAKWTITGEIVKEGA